MFLGRYNSSVRQAAGSRQQIAEAEAKPERTQPTKPSSFEANP